MIPGNNLSQNEILAKINQASRKARIISIILTILAVLILGIVTYITNQALKKRALLLKDIDVAQTKLDDLNIRIKTAEKSTFDKPECTETRNILTAENTDIDVNPNPTASNTPLTNPTITPTPQKLTTPDDTKPSIVYVQVVDDLQKPSAQQFIRSLQNEKFVFPGIETKNVNLSQTQIRFFGDGDETRAKELARLLQSRGISARVLKINYKSDKQNLPLEIWFSNNAFNK